MASDVEVNLLVESNSSSIALACSSTGLAVLCRHEMFIVLTFGIEGMLTYIGDQLQDRYFRNRRN